MQAFGSDLRFLTSLSNIHGRTFTILKKEHFALQYFKMENKLTFGAMIKIKAKE